MIKVTRISGGTFVVNSDLIEFIEEKPETIICLTTGKKIMVRESVDEVIEKVICFKGNVRRIPIVPGAIGDCMSESDREENNESIEEYRDGM